MHTVRINNNKCVKCALCKKECPAGIIQIGNSGYPEILEDKIGACMGCQHCFAICPEEAISVDNIAPENSYLIKDNYPEYKELEILVKGRRSIRKFKNENIDKKDLEKLLFDALHAPTGVNAMQVKFTVINDKAVLDKYKKDIYAKIKELADKQELPEGLEFFEGIANKYFEKNLDIIFRNAPHLVIATAGKSCPTPDIDTTIALSYLDLLAPAMGYGTLWCGMAKWAIHDILPGYVKTLGIPEDHQMGYVMLLGKPDVKFKRTVQKTGSVKYIK